MPNQRTLPRIVAALLSASLLAAVATYGGVAIPRVAAQPAKGTPTPRDWPMFGGTPSRNLANPFVKNLPTTWNVEDGKRKNIKWVAELGGSCSFGGPVIANGRVFVTTNNQSVGMPPARGVLKVFRESDGQLLWQKAHEQPKDFLWRWDAQGLPSTPTVEGNHAYYIAPANELICANAETGKIVWRYHMTKELKVFAATGVIHSAPPLGPPLVYGDLVFAFTGNGRNDEGKLISPEAPSFVAVYKKTGKLAWQSNLPGAKIIDGQWSSPTLAIVNNRPQVIFAGGDGVIYGIEPQTGKLVWKCDCLPVREKQPRYIDNYFLGTPVVVGDRLFVGMGVTPIHPGYPRWSYFLCLDITKTGDASFKSYDAKAPANRDTALIWAFGGPVLPAPAKGRQVFFGPTMSTAAVHDGLVYISEESGYLHCLDAFTGERYWVHDAKSEFRGSPFYADGRVYLGTANDDFFVFAHGRQKKLVAQIKMDAWIRSAPISCNGVLYIATDHRLYAIANDK